MRFEILEGLQAQRAHLGNTGIVDEAGQAALAECRAYRCDGCINLVLPGDVEDQGTKVSRCAFGQGGSVLVGAHTGKHRPAFRGEMMGSGASDTG
jgi:hypothetical protein